MEEPEPAPKTYGFKEREFQRDNPPASDLPPAPTAKELAMMAGPVVRTGAPAGPKVGDPNDVFAKLQQNRAMEISLGKDQIEIRKIKSRRKRDYWLLLVSSELLLGLITWQGRANPIVFVSALAGMVLVGVTLTWVMWQVMDRY